MTRIIRRRAVWPPGGRTRWWFCRLIRVMYADYFHISPGTGAEGDFGRFRAPHAKVQVTYDRELVRLICQEADRADVPAGTMGEEDRRLDHGTMISAVVSESV